MELGVLEALVAIVLIILSIYYYTSSRLNYWKKRGVPGPTPVPFFGNFAGVVFKRTSVHEKMAAMYTKWRKEPFFGMYRGHSPVLIVTDLDLVKNVLIKDFHVFFGRGNKINEEVDPLAGHLFNIDGPRWKALRAKLTPVFTSGKLKHMFDLMLECADHYETYLLEQGGKGNILEFREVAAKFTTDVIGSCAFGISMNALSREDSEFRKVGRRVFASSHLVILKRMLRESAPKLYAKLRLKLVPDDITEFFISSIRETIEYRKKENVVRHDLVDTLVDIRKNDNKDFEFTEGVMAAQAFVFFVAGFETSSTSISFALQELAHNPEVQEKLINEISGTLRKNEGKLSYEVVNEMKYLDMVIQESLRKDPPGTILTRNAFERYTIPGTDVTLEPGTKVIIPVYSIHHDAEYYPNPEVFDPERFSEENKRMRHPMAHLPFGDGPKNCIGARFASYQVKLGLIKVLKNFRVKPTSLSPFPYEIDRGSVILAPTGGVHLRLEPIV